MSNELQGINPLDVRKMMIDEGVKSKALAIRHRVTEVTVSRALNGDPNCAWLLPKFIQSVNNIRSRRLERQKESKNNPAAGVAQTMSQS